MPATVKRTITIDHEADQHLARMVPAKRGHGAFISRLIHEHRLRQELSEKYGTLRVAEEWDESGICVE
jgi:hypothetical protein